MSKVIKSSFTTTNSHETKTIQLKKIVLPNFEQEEEIDQDSYEDQLESLKESAEQKIEEARLEAERILQQAENEFKMRIDQIEQAEHQSQQRVEEAYQRAQEEGYEAGFKQGLEQGQQQFDVAISEIHSIINSAKEDYFDRIQQAEPVIIELAFKVAQKITGDILAEDETKWVDVVKKAIDEVRDHEEIKIIVPPNWYDITLRHKSELQSLLLRAQNLMIYPDPSLDENGCKIETPFGQVDATIDTQLTEIKEKLLEKLKEGHDERQ